MNIRFSRSKPKALAVIMDTCVFNLYLPCLRKKINDFLFTGFQKIIPDMVLHGIARRYAKSEKDEEQA